MHSYPRYSVLVWVNDEATDEREVDDYDGATMTARNLLRVHAQGRDVYSVLAEVHGVVESDDVADLEEAHGLFSVRFETFEK